MKRHSGYLRFVQACREAKEQPNVPWWSESFEDLHAARVHLAGMCSTWTSWCDEDKGHLLIGQWQVNTLLDATANTDILIVMAHHPLSYLPDFDADAVDQAIRRQSKAKMKIILRGHLHQQRALIPRDPDNAWVELAAGAAYDGSRFPNAFQLVEPGFPR